MTRLRRARSTARVPISSSSATRSPWSCSGTTTRCRSRPTTWLIMWPRSRARPRALVVADLPWLSYHVSTAETVHNAARLVRAGAGAVKLEGGRKRLDSVHAILDAEIPVMGHIGLTPQSIHALGGFKVQGKELDAAKALADDACALADAGCFAIVLECVPDAVARVITESVSIPTIGIGAGRHCDGQVLVWHDLLGFAGPDHRAPKFVRA